MGKGQTTLGLAGAAMLAVLYSAPSLAGLQVWNYDDSVGFTGGGNNGNSLATSSGGINLTTTGWSDTGDVPGNDDTIETAKLGWARADALGIQNRDEGTSSPNHSVDSVTSDSDGEFDMLLLTFSTAVTLTDIDLDWAVGGNASSRADVSILAWNGSGSAAFGPTSTWANIFASNGGNFVSAGNHSNVGLNTFAVNSTLIESTTWLIGAYNPVFGTGGDAGDDGFKLHGVRTSTPDRDPPTVPVPGTVALVLAGLLALRVRQAQKK